MYTAHRDGDGCAGGFRVLHRPEYQEVTDLAAEMMHNIARGDLSAAVGTGGYIGVHYGVQGEYLLAIQLAHQVSRLTTTAHREDGTPRIALAMDIPDQTMLDLFSTLTAVFPELHTITGTEVARGVRDSIPLVEAFVKAVDDDDKPAAFPRWRDMYEVTDPPRAGLIRTTACSAHLAAWATRTSVVAVRPVS